VDRDDTLGVETLLLRHPDQVGAVVAAVDDGDLEVVRCAAARTSTRLPSTASRQPSVTICTVRAAIVAASWMTAPGWLRGTSVPSAW